jgi:hypothetical protein
MLMTAETTRRLILAGAAAAVPTLSLPTFADPAPDPIFAAIEKNRQAYIARMRACRIEAEAVPNEPRWNEIRAAATEADAASDKAALALTTTQPTTMAGVLALLEHVEAFNEGEISLADTRDLSGVWHSGPMFWPVIEDENKENIFGYLILVNVHRALQTLTSRRNFCGPTAT